MTLDDPDFPPKTRSQPGSRIAYGYEASPDDPLKLVPIPEFRAPIRATLDFLDDGGTLREAADYLTAETGKKISHQGINNIWKERRGANPESKRVRAQKDYKKKHSPKTGPDKAKAKIKRKLADAKRVATMQENKLAAWVEPGQEPATDTDTDPAPIEGVTENRDNGLDHTAPPEKSEIIFRPNPGPQTEFLAATEREVLYGGAAGGGKSYALLADPMRYMVHPAFSGLILRRTNDELREMIWKSQELYPKAFPGAKWSERKSQWQFPDGGRLWLTYLERPEDVLRYQGQAFSYIGFDELTQHPTPFAWDYMRSRLRTTATDLPIFMRATTNPGGPGHSWVKRMFIDPSPANTRFAAQDLETNEALTYPPSHEKAGKPLFYRRFIPASLYDNPHLMEDGSYEANLLSLPESQRRQLLEGDWSVAEGAAFPEFRTNIHVCDPFEVPDTWRRFRSCDYGYSSWSAVHWFAIDPAYETLVCYRELYVSKHTGRDLAAAVLKEERGESIGYGVLDSSCWHNRGQIGPSIAEEMISMGCRWRPSDRTSGARVAGKNMMHERLKVNAETERPGMIFFNTCRQIISTLPLIPSDPKGSDDIDGRYQDDHAYDSVRYGVMSRPRAFSPFADERGYVPQNTWRPADPVFGY